MNNIDSDIERLLNLRRFLKIELNSTYGKISQNNFQSLFDKRNGVTQEIRKLQLIKSRLEKINHIKSKI